MSRIFVPTTNALDWKKRLADPNKQWVRGHSALELAVAWEVAQRNPSLRERGLPAQVAELLDKQPDTNGASLIFAIPEQQVVLEGLGKASQTDLWALLATPGGLASMAVEGKAGEPFDRTVEDWMTASTSDNSTANRRVRLAGLCKTLGLSEDIIDAPSFRSLRYQLLHRTASTLLEAQRCGAGHAIMLVQSFDCGSPRKQPDSFRDFSAFVNFMGAHDIVPGQLLPARSAHGVRLSLAWLDCDCVTHADVSLAGT